eukprot:TRINITY_DN1561_c0_g2_i1.p1 TRINITY_DN1561_c0_g2~~TRINITY_DN1561_c0_g2_i1.p1  ORF type:complete len:149 (+),score=14.02 TRINITY_DN1561_c0_g2_i1:177-623(+)
MTTPTLHCLPPNTNPFHPVLLRKCIPKVKHFEEIGIERFVHDTINDLIHGEYDVTPYTTFKPEDLQTLFEAFKIFTTNFVNFNLSKEQVLCSCFFFFYILNGISFWPISPLWDVEKKIDDLWPPLFFLERKRFVRNLPIIRSNLIRIT